MSAPRLHAPRVYGARPGNPFLFSIPATGSAPLRFSAQGLPEGLALDPANGRITGATRRQGTYDVRLSVRNAHGEDNARLDLRISGLLALTPPLGWNSWNCWGTAVDDAKIRAAADAMVSSGLAVHGWTYINIDDAWEGVRDSRGCIQPNDKFPDMKSLADYVHARGLKIGIYSSPNAKTCAGYEGSLGHEEQDARTYAEWGMDYLKYDWCGCGAPGYREPYRLMRAALDRCGRDIVYSLCEYGRAAVWTWGAEVGGNCWRTTEDITDTWESMAGIGFSQNGLAAHAGPGRWNDPDMLVVGRLGWGPKLRPTRLTPDEQVTHLSLWALLAAPLLIGCDLTRLDEFTLGLLTNDEVLAVNQDPLGRQGVCVRNRMMLEAWTKPLADGTAALGLFNRSGEPAEAKVEWRDLMRVGSQPVRDLWRREDLGSFVEGFSAVLPPHAARLLRVGEPVSA